MIEIIKKLRSLKLAGIAGSLDNRNKYAMENQLSYLDFLSLLIDDEYSNRQSNSFKRRYSKSKLVLDKTIDNYDFVYQPELDKKLIMELLSCRFINEAMNIIFMGNPGVGKTHLANAIGVEAIKAGYKVLFIHNSELIERLYLGKGDGTYHATLKNFVDVDLLIIDELGFKKINTGAVDEFFEVIRKRYESKSVILTTNRSFEEWGNVFGDTVLASAIIDRLIHHSHVIKITGKSYRVKNMMKK